MRAVERYAATGRGDVAALGPGAGAGYRLRVGDRHVLFDAEPGRLIILRVLPRGRAYRR